MTSNTSIDFFISYAEEDKGKAEWIAWQLEEMGHTLEIEAWDFTAGDNLTLKVDKALTNAKQIIAVLSPEYLVSDSTSAEWAAGFAGDPTGKKGKLLLVKVKQVELTGFFKQLIIIDLVGLKDKVAKEKFLNEIKASKDGMRNKPSIEPLFSETTSEPTLAPKTISEQEKKEYVFKAGLVDKDEQLSHVLNNIGDKFYGNATSQVSQSAFVLIGAGSQWPHALGNVLCNAIKRWLKFNNNGISKKISPELIYLAGGSVFNDGVSPESHLWELLADGVPKACPPKRKAIGSMLGNEKVPNIFFRPLSVKESKNPVLVHGMLEAWESIELPKYSPRHILILFYECSDSRKWQGFSQIYTCLPWSKKHSSLLEKIKQHLLKEAKGFSKKEVETWINSHFLPEITSPNKQNIKDWVDSYFHPEQVQQVKEYVIDEIKAEHKRRKKDKNISKERTARIRLTKGNIEMHHHDLKEILVNALKEFG